MPFEIEEQIKSLWDKFKFQPLGWAIAVAAIFWMILGVVGRFSDAGFGNEVTQNRYYIILVSIVISTGGALVCWIVSLQYKNNELQQNITDLNQKLSAALDEVRQKDESNGQLQKTILNLTKDLGLDRVCEVYMVQLFDEKLFLRIKKRESQTIRIDAKVTVFDKENGDVMGVFKVVETQEEEAAAEGTFISPVWLGFIKAVNSAESSMPPKTVAILFADEEYNEQ
jgi:hypothetical protein